MTPCSQNYSTKTLLLHKRRKNDHQHLKEPFHCIVIHLLCGKGSFSKLYSTPRNSEHDLKVLKRSALCNIKFELDCFTRAALELIKNWGNPQIWRNITVKQQFRAVYRDCNWNERSTAQDSSVQPNRKWFWSRNYLSRYLCQDEEKECSFFVTTEMLKSRFNALKA